jgi:hypothetical protein
MRSKTRGLVTKAEETFHKGVDMGVFDLPANYGLEIRSSGRTDGNTRFRIYRRIQLSGAPWGDAGDYSFGAGPVFGPHPQGVEYKVEIYTNQRGAPPVIHPGEQSDDGKQATIRLGNLTIVCKRIPPGPISVLSLDWLRERDPRWTAILISDDTFAAEIPGGVPAESYFD